MTDTEATIVAFIGELNGDGVPVAPDTPIMESGLLDSMGLVRLIQFVDERFGVSIPDGDVTPELFESPRHLATYVQQRLG
jgi:acyl carrier protein